MGFRRLCVVMMLVGLLSPLTGPAAAQDTHYWTLQYGMHAELLNGVAIGSQLGTSNLYYNPGAYALIEDPTALSTTLAFYWRKITVEDGAASGEDLSSSRTSTIPSLVAGRLPSVWEGHRFAYSVLTRQETEIRFGSYRIDPYTGGSAISGEMVGDQSLRETWVGVTWAYKLSEQVGLGATGYMAYRSQRVRLQASLEEYVSPDQADILTLADSLEFGSVRLLMKGGVSFDYSPLTFGMTVTTPGADLWGSGKVYTNAFGTPGGSPDGQAFLSSYYQDGLDARYKSSWALGFGAAYDLGGTKLHFSLEWFDDVNRFKVMDTQEFQAQSSGEEVSIDVYHQLESVTNFGIGVEHQLKEDLQLYLSFSTDRSAWSENSHISLTNYDIYHLTGGVGLQFMGRDLTLGMGVSFGSDEGQRLANLRSEKISAGLTGLTDQSTDIKYTRLKFVLGFEL